MSYLNVASGTVVSDLPGEQRAGFIRRTYVHVAGAIAAFALVESYLLSLGWGEVMLQYMSVSRWSFILMFVSFNLNA